MQSKKHNYSILTKAFISVFYLQKICISNIWTRFELHISPTPKRKKNHRGEVMTYLYTQRGNFVVYINKIIHSFLYYEGS